MKKEYLKPGTLFFETDIRFEPLVVAEPLEVIEDEDKIHKAYKHLVIRGSQIRFIRYGFGIIFSQKIIVRQSIFWLHYFDMSSEVWLRPITNALLISLNYMLRGRLEVIMNGEHFNLLPEKYQLYGLAENMAYEAKFPIGRSISFHTTVPADLIPEMIEVYHDDKKLKKFMESNFKGIYYPNLFRITPAIRKHIDIILAQKKANTAKEKLNRDIKWERELLDLLNHYLKDKNGASKLEEWHKKGQLQLTDLEEYVIDNLKYQTNSPSDPLFLNNILPKVGMTSQQFRKLMQTVFGCTWKQFVHRVRMERAEAALMHDSHLSVSDIASTLGYTVPSHFARAFRDYFGSSPLDYRRSKQRSDHDK